MTRFILFAVTEGGNFEDATCLVCLRAEVKEYNGGMLRAQDIPILKVGAKHYSRSARKATGKAA